MLELSPDQTETNFFLDMKIEGMLKIACGKILHCRYLCDSFLQRHVKNNFEARIIQIFTSGKTKVYFHSRLYYWIK